MKDGLSIREIDRPFETISAHRELQRAIEWIHRLLHSELRADEATMKAIEVTHAVLMLRDQLQRRFEREEAMLQYRHRALLDSAERMLPKPDEVDSGNTTLVKLRTNFETFVRYLQAYEATDNPQLEIGF